MKLYAVTGPMAAGKNVVCSILEEAGFACVDADVLTHKAVEISKDKIIETFGTEAKQKNISLLNKDGKINRRSLGQIVFTSPENIAKQEQIIHPIISKMMDEFIEENFAQGKNVVLNATVLYKIETIKRVDTIIFVTASFCKRFFRVLKRDNIKVKQILQRFHAQKNLFTKYKFLNTDIYKVNNNVSIKRLRKKILKIVQK
ncbi:MAG: dephospho-CoA kinase [Treponema sp.]|nr:dephospho-CoA kinase [Treponema sp.]